MTVFAAVTVVKLITSAPEPELIVPPLSAVVKVNVSINEPPVTESKPSSSAMLTVLATVLSNETMSVPEPAVIDELAARAAVNVNNSPPTIPPQTPSPRPCESTAYTTH